MTRYWIETACEHGKVASHPMKWGGERCPGGVRRELTINRIAGAQVLADNDGIAIVEWHKDLADAVINAALGDPE